jgi:iron complex transport system ATP-binding protein
MVLHDLNLASLYADRVALMVAGQIYACGLPDEVLTSQNLSAVYHVPVNVIPHPEHGTPLILPDGIEGEKACM